MATLPPHFRLTAALWHSRGNCRCQTSTSCPWATAMPPGGNRRRSPRITCGISALPGRRMDAKLCSLPVRRPAADCFGWQSISRPEPHRLGFAPGDASAPAISMRPMRLAYSLEKLHANIWRLELGNSGGMPVAPPARFISSTKWDLRRRTLPPVRRSHLFRRDREILRFGCAKATVRMPSNSRP